MSTQKAVATNLTAVQAKGLRRLGDATIPGDGDLPSFSEAGNAADIGRMLPYMNEADRSSLLGLLGVCAFLPRFAIRGILFATTRWRRAPEPLAGLLRMMNIGIKGVVHSLYWSDTAGRGIHRAIGYDARVDEVAYEKSLRIISVKEGR